METINTPTTFIFKTLPHSACFSCFQKCPFWDPRKIMPVKSISLILLIIIGSKVVHRLFIYHCCMFVSTFHIVYFAEAVLRVNLSPKQTGRADIFPPLSPILGLTNFLQLLDINTILYHAISYNTIQYHAIPRNTIQYHAIPCNTMQYHAIPCNSM